MEPQVSASSDSPARNLKPVACFCLTAASLSLLDTIIFRSAYRSFLTAEDSSLIEVLSPPPSFFRLKSRPFVLLPVCASARPYTIHTTPTPLPQWKRGSTGEVRRPPTP